MSIPLEVLLGPVGALGLALWALRALWLSHLDADARERKRADEAYSRLEALVEALRSAASQQP